MASKNFLLPVVLLWQMQFFLNNFVIKIRNYTNEKPEIFRSIDKFVDADFIMQIMEQRFQAKVWLPHEWKKYWSGKNPQWRSRCNKSC